jgi:hypothetical protein
MSSEDGKQQDPGQRHPPEAQASGYEPPLAEDIDTTHSPAEAAPGVPNSSF